MKSFFKDLFHGVREVILDKEIWVSIAPFKVTSFVNLPRGKGINNSSFEKEGMFLSN